MNQIVDSIRCANCPTCWIPVPSYDSMYRYCKWCGSLLQIQYTWETSTGEQELGEVIEDGE